MRCFVALEIDDTIKDRLEAAQGLFRPLGGKVGWCSRGQMHLTLQFLGEAPDDRVPPVVEALRSAAAAIPAFEFTVAGLGAFPPSGSPRVLWVGIQRCEPLIELQRRVEAALEPLGFPPEDRAFTPHLTLGRVKERVDARAYRRVIAENAGFVAGVQPATRVVLFSSQLKPTGSVYTPVADVALRKQ